MTSYINFTEAEKSRIRLQNCFADWIGNSPAGFNFAATLTYPAEFDVRTRQMAEKFASRFRKRYNIEFGYGSNPERKQTGDQTEMAPMVMLNDGNGRTIRYHHHLALVKPADMDDSDYAVIVDDCWQRCLRGHTGITEVEPIYSDGWKKYLSEKLHIGDQEVFDVFNSNIY